MEYDGEVFIGSGLMRFKIETTIIAALKRYYMYTNVQEISQKLWKVDFTFYTNKNEIIC